MNNSIKHSAQIFALAVLLMTIALSWTMISATSSAQAVTPKLNITDNVLAVGQSEKLKVSGTKKVAWSSSNKSVATVSKSGKVRAKKAGTATITAKTGKKKLKSRVTVRKFSKAKDVLIAYFTQTKTTAAVAKRIKSVTGGDLLRITPKKKYTRSYNKLTEIAQEEKKADARPKTTTRAKSIRKYDTIYIGYPIWWDSTPRVVNTFIESLNLKGKTVVPFCTSGGSGIDGSLSAFRKSAKGATIKAGFEGDFDTSKAQVRRWLTRINELK